MKFKYHILIFLFTGFTGQFLWSQDDGVVTVEDSIPPLEFHLQSFGTSFRDGSTQFFDGYNYQILLANSQSGLPLFFDWNNYQGEILLPNYQQFEVHAGLVDTTRGIKLRGGVTYFNRFDSMATTSFLARDDTILGRNAGERTTFYGITVGCMKMSRKLGNFVRLYGGAEIEMLFSRRSDISFVEYAYDFGDNEFLSRNNFEVVGKPKFNFFGSALLGFETIFFKHFGFFGEIKSGMGTQIVLREGRFGMAKTAYHLGLNYYLFDYKRKPFPLRSVLVEEEEPIEID